MTLPSPTPRAPEPLPVWEFELPLRTVAETNRRGHWAKAARRAETQRNAVALAMKLWVTAWIRGWSAFRITLTRIAPRELDEGDNLPSATKAIRDEVVSQLGLPNDRDPRLNFVYSQERGAPKTYAVRVQIERRDVQPAAPGEADEGD